MRKPAGHKRRIDWDAVRRRLDASSLAPENILAADEQRLQDVYSRRAAKLAEPPCLSGEAHPALPVLVFSLQGERFAVPLDALSEVARFRGCTPVPSGPADLMGVISLHGKIHSVLDPSDVLGLGRSQECSGGFLLCLRLRDREAVVRVDAIEGMRTLTGDETRSYEGGSPRTSAKVILGVTSDRLHVISIKELFGSATFHL